MNKFYQLLLFMWSYLYFTFTFERWFSYVSDIWLTAFTLNISSYWLLDFIVSDEKSTVHIHVSLYMMCHFILSDIFLCL